MSGILNKLGLGHKDHHATDAAHHASTTTDAHHASTGLTGTGAHSATTTTTTTSNSGLNNQSGVIGTTAPYGSSTATTATRTGAAYTNTTGAVAHEGLASHNIHQSNNLSGDDAMTRSEEQLRVAKATVETGKAELNKTVETVHVEQAVPVQRERVVIEREPITQSNLPSAMSGPAISEAHYETTLKEDRVAATKETVPIERIRLAKQVETSVESVGADLRKEHIDLTMHNADQSKIDTTSSNYMAGRTTAGSLASDKIDTHARSGLTNENAQQVRNSHINTTSNTRNL